MAGANLGTKRQCPKCDAKFYDFGAADPITCPKCKHDWREGAGKKPRAKPAKAKKEPAPTAKRKASPEEMALLAAELPGELPEVDEGEIEELEPIEDEEVEITSLEEVEEHEEEEEADPNSDDAEDEMFTDLPEEAKLMDDLDQYIEKDEDEDDEGEEE